MDFFCFFGRWCSVCFLDSFSCGIGNRLGDGECQGGHRRVAFVCAPRVLRVPCRAAPRHAASYRIIARRAV